MRQVAWFEKRQHLHDNLDKQTNKTQNKTKTKQTVLSCAQIHF